MGQPGLLDPGFRIRDLGCAMWDLEIRDLEFGMCGLEFGTWVHSGCGIWDAI